MLYFIIGFILGAVVMFLFIKKFIFDFDSSNCRDTCPNKKNEKGIRY